MIAIRYALSDDAKGVERERLLEEHKAYLRSAAFRIILSGPFLSGGTASRAGAMIVAEVEDLAVFQGFSDGDPFVRHHVYSHVELAEWKPSLGDVLDRLA